MVLRKLCGTVAGRASRPEFYQHGKSRDAKCSGNQSFYRLLGRTATSHWDRVVDWGMLLGYHYISVVVRNIHRT